MSATGGAGTWSRQRERGSSFLLQVMLWITLHLGWHAANLLLYPIAACFYATSPEVRAASRTFLSRARERRATRADVFRHILSFARVTLDRVFLLSGRTEGFRLEVHGLDTLAALAAQGRGCVLLGSHLGSFEVLRMVARDCPVPVRPLMFRRNAGALTRLLEQLDPALHGNVIDIGATGAMLQAHEAVARGEFIAMLADRTPTERKVVTLPFLGGEAAFPAGPILLAATLGAPTFLFFGVRTGHRSYRVHFEPFADPVRLRRETRQADIKDWVGRYAARLEERCRTHPLNWFNFYPFWKDPIDAAPHPTVRAGLPRLDQLAGGCPADARGGAAS